MIFFNQYVQTGITSNAPTHTVCGGRRSAPHITPVGIPAPGQATSTPGTLFQLSYPYCATVGPIENVSVHKYNGEFHPLVITLLHKGLYRGKGETPVARFLRGRIAPSISAPRFLWLQVWGNFAP